MNKHGIKIDALNLNSTLAAKKSAFYSFKKLKTLVFLLALPSCVMTRTEGDALTIKMRHMEDEVAKLQRVRHDVEILLSGQMRDLVDRIAHMESQLVSLRESLYESSNNKSEFLSEIASLRGELDEAKFQYRNLENDQKVLLQKQQALKQAQNNVAIPPLKKEHLELAKKLQSAQKYDQALYLFDEYIKNYESDKESSAQAYLALGQIYRKLAEDNKNLEEKDKLYKKSVVSWQKLLEQNNSALKEEALFQMGIVLKAMGNAQAAGAAFKELITHNKNSKRALEAKKQLASITAE